MEQARNDQAIARDNAEVNVDSHESVAPETAMAAPKIDPAKAQLYNSNRRAKRLKDNQAKAKAKSDEDKEKILELTKKVGQLEQGITEANEEVLSVKKSSRQALRKVEQSAASAQKKNEQQLRKVEQSAATSQKKNEQALRKAEQSAATSQKKNEQALQKVEQSAATSEKKNEQALRKVEQLSAISDKSSKKLHNEEMRNLQKVAEAAQRKTRKDAMEKVKSVVAKNESAIDTYEKQTQSVVDTYEKKVAAEQEARVCAEQRMQETLSAVKDYFEKQKLTKAGTSNECRSLRHSKRLSDKDSLVKTQQLEKQVAITDKQRSLRNISNGKVRELNSKLKQTEAKTDKLKSTLEATRMELDEKKAAMEDMSAASSTETKWPLRKVSPEVGKGQKVWPAEMDLYIMELLVIGTPPASVPQAIASSVANLLEMDPEELPSISYVRGLRTAIRILGETMAAYKLGKSGSWAQLFFDGTTRRQIPFQNLVIALDTDEELCSLVLSSCMIVEGETAKQQVEAVLDMIETAGKRLDMWRAEISDMHPSFEHDIPDPSTMNIGKLEGGAVTTDTCNAARSAKKLLCEEVLAAAKERAANVPDGNDPKVYEIDCFNHLRNIWLGASSKAMSKELTVVLREWLDNIDPHLRVSTSIEAVLRAVDKEFSLSANYAKGHGMVFKAWMELNYPKAQLLHVLRTSGSRQDVCVEGAGAVYWNRKYWIEFLDKELTGGRRSVGNLLQENLWVILSSMEMTALVRVNAIIHIAIAVPTRWLAGNCHTLASDDISVRSMGRMLDMLEDALTMIVDQEEFFLCEPFMMSIFDELLLSIPSFSEFMTYYFEGKKSAKVDGTGKDFPYQKLREELFHPQQAVNQATRDMTIRLGRIAVETILRELRDPKKATSNYLSSVNGEYSWENTSTEDHEALKDRVANNDLSESAHGGTSHQINLWGRILLTNAAGMDQVRRNGNFSRCDKLGSFLKLPFEMKRSLLAAAKKHSPKQRQWDRDAISRQTAEKQRKLAEKKTKAEEKAAGANIEALYYYGYHGSQSRWKTEKEMDDRLEEMGSNTAKIKSLKDNIKCYVLGLGRTDLAITWSQHGCQKPWQTLREHLAEILKDKKTLIPDKPPVVVPQRKVLPTLGTTTSDVMALDAAKCVNLQEVEDQTRQLLLEREAKGIGGDRSTLHQPHIQPPVDVQLVGKRLDYCFLYEAVDENEPDQIVWCVGEVLRVSDGNNIPKTSRTNFKAGEAAEFRWEPRNDIDGDEVTISVVPLKPHLFNKGKVGAWRYHVT